MKSYEKSSHAFAICMSFITMFFIIVAICIIFFNFTIILIFIIFIICITFIIFIIFLLQCSPRQRLHVQWGGGAEASLLLKTCMQRQTLCRGQGVYACRGKPSAHDVYACKGNPSAQGHAEASLLLKP